MSNTTRRAALAASVAAVVGIVPAATAAPPLLAQPDAAEARMITMCAEYLTAVRLYDAGGGADDLLWERIESLDAKLEAWEPRTFAGIEAAAGMVAALASNDPECCDPWGSGYTGHWPETVARGVLRLAGAEPRLGSGRVEKAPAVAPPDAELIALCGTLPQVLSDLHDTPDDLADDAPEWAPYDRIADTIAECPATTLEGLIAKARAAKVKAGAEGDVDDTDPGGIPAVWAWAIVKDLLRMGGEA